MPLFIAALLGGLSQAAFSIVGRVLISLGIGLFVMTGIDTSLTWLKNIIISNFGGVSSLTMQVMSTCQLGSAVSVILSALSARLLFDGMTGGTIKRWVTK